MEAVDIAGLLNHHFEILSRCIEAEGGTVDKFIGDSVMAFWGAPDSVEDHADRGMRVAAAIQQAVIRDNDARRAKGRGPIAVRVGVHTGPVVVGNIASSSRVNYTVVGDTVNAASRLESLAKEIREFAAPAAGSEAAGDCVVLLSDETRTRLEGEFPLRPMGRHTLRGRSGTVLVYQLLASAPGGDPLPVAPR